jgi:ribonuclease HII
MHKGTGKGAKNTIFSSGVIGIDEVGRGPLAGPVTVCAVYLENEKEAKKDLFGNTIRDSKKLSKSNRIYIYKTIREKRKLRTRILYSLSSRPASYIDRHGINKAVASCIRSCVCNLEKQGVRIMEMAFRLDAGLRVPIEGIMQQAFIKGDEKYVEIALASILAKVTRDKYMEKLSKTYKGYGWEGNAGYGTFTHREAIKKQGITKHHRRSFLKALFKAK